MKKITLHFYADPGHGWLSVKKQYLETLGIAAQITQYSYQRNDTAYLEEDCDLSTFMQACDKAGIKVSIIEHNGNRQSKIRGYARYRQ